MSSEELRRAVYETIRERPSGITRRALQSRFGVPDPAAEDDRKKVWRLAAAVAGLVRDRFVLTEAVEGEVVLYPQMA